MRECLLVALMWFAPMFVLNAPLAIATCIEIFKRMEIDRLSDENVQKIITDKARKNGV